MTSQDETQCPVEVALAMIGGKWKLLILYQLRNGTLRFGALRRRVPQINERMLTRCLRALARDGLVTRTVHAQVPPRVDYALTEAGGDLLPVLDQLDAWGAQMQGRAGAQTD